jgi:hypothetical protein
MQAAWISMHTCANTFGRLDPEHRMIIPGAKRGVARLVTPDLPDSVLLLLVSAALLLALSGAIDSDAMLPEGAVAIVNGQPIGDALLAMRIQAVERQLRRPASAVERAEILARLIDEELLLQQGLALELPRKDARLRSQIVQEAIAQAVAESAAMPVSEEELQRFFDDNRPYFARPAVYRVWRFEFADAAAAGDAAADPAGLLDGHLGRRDPLLPDAALSEASLRDYLGASLSAKVVRLQAGAVLRQGETSVLLLRERIEAGAPALAAIRTQVENEFRRRRDEQALAAQVTALRDAARLRMATDGR